MLACSPACFVLSEKFSVWVYWKVLQFLTNQAARFISHGMVRSYFSGNSLLSFLLWYDFKILVKSRGGGTFLCLASPVNIQHLSLIFFQLKAKYPIVHFLDGTILNLIYWKINKKCWNFHCFSKFSLFYPLYDFRVLVQIYQLIIS